MCAQSGPNALGPALHLKQTDPIASQSIGNADAGRGGNGVFVIQEAQPACKTPAWPPSSDHIEMFGSLILSSLFAGAYETAGGIAVSFALARIMLPVAFAQLVITIWAWCCCPAALLVVGKTRGGNLRNYSETSQ